jgi:hypothetical protein
MPDGMELITRIVVELDDQSDRTKMVVTHVGVPADSPGAQGWHAALDTFAARLATTASPTVGGLEPTLSTSPEAVATMPGLTQRS